MRAGSRGSTVKDVIFLFSFLAPHIFTIPRAAGAQLEQCRGMGRSYSYTNRERS